MTSETEWEERAESMTCEYEQPTGDEKHSILCQRDGTYATAKECNACKGIDAPKRDRSAGRASKAKKLSYYEYALEMRDWARIWREKATA